jgi:hypothetical protein
MRDERFNVVLVFLAASVILLHTALPDRGLIAPFPFSEQEIYFRTYVWIAAMYFALFLLTMGMFTLSNQAREFFRAATILQACQFIEYFVNYNETWFEVNGIPITVATLRFPILFFYGVRTIYSWKI